MKTYKKILNVFIWVVAAALFVEFAAWVLDYVLKDPLAAKKLPYPHDVLLSFPQYGSHVLTQAGVTLSRAVIGFLWGAGIGIVLALAMSLSKLTEKLLLPYLLISQMIPILGLAPIIFGLVKDIGVSRIVIAAYITFFPVSISFLSGLKSVGESERMLMETYAASTYNRYRKLMLPASLPHLFTGLKLAAPMAVTASVLVDTLSTTDGIGYIIVLTLYGGGTAGQFWPAVLVASAMGVLSFAFVAAIESIAVPWKRKDMEGAETT